MSTPSAPSAPSAYSRTNPFPARLTENRVLSKAGSTKDTRHIVVDITGSGLVYNAGDSLGVFAQNPPEVVDEIIGLLGLNPEAIVPSPKGEASLRTALLSGCILNRSNKKFVKAIAEKLPAGERKDSLAAIVANEEDLEDFVHTRDYVDVLLEYPGVHLTSEEFIALVNKTAPRLYSIASSGTAHPTHVHLTVAIVRYETHGRKKKGLASGYMADHSPIGEPVVPVFVQPTRHFHLPAADVPIIMVGPGTGIAPFRAFLQERKATGAKGRNWLFFGDQTKSGDFLYEEEFDAYQKEGLLTRLDTAFSRDQVEKIYVQNRMLENGAEIWKWFQEGAHFYVCGDAKRMAKDVHQALITIAEQHGGLDREKATEYIEVTFAKTEKRYLKDVY